MTKSWSFRDFRKGSGVGGRGGSDTAFDSGTRHDSHLPRELGRKAFRIRSWEEKMPGSCSLEV